MCYGAGYSLECIGMRHILAPGYFDIAREIVWEAATRDVPALWKKMICLVHMLEPASLSERRNM